MRVFHAHADMENEGIQRLVDAFSPPLVISGGGSSGMLRRVATEDGIPTLTIETGEANRFQPLLIELALQGIENVLAAYEMCPEATPQRVDFQKVARDELLWRVDMRRWNSSPVLNAAIGQYAW